MRLAPLMERVRLLDSTRSSIAVKHPSAKPEDLFFLVMDVTMDCVMPYSVSLESMMSLSLRGTKFTATDSA